MAKNVIILGAGGHAKVIADIVEKSGDNVVGFLDDNEDNQNKTIYNNKRVIGKINDCLICENTEFIIAIGNNKVRKKIAEQYNLNWYTAIHPSAIIASDVTIGRGTVVTASAIINPGTKIGQHCIINTRSSVDHDNVIEDYVHISPGATLAGTVTIKELTWVCAGATVINNVTIEKNNVIGAGAVVIKDITDTDRTYVGVPAKMVKKDYVQTVEYGTSNNVLKKHI